MTDWTTPTSWVNGVVPGATDLNEQLRDNMNHLKLPPFFQVVTASAGTVSASASTAIPITAGVSATLTTFGGHVQCYFRAKASGAVNQGVFNLDHNGTAFTDRVSGLATGLNGFVEYHVWVTGVPSGSNVFLPTWLQPVGEFIGVDISSHPLIFWVREG